MEGLESAPLSLGEAQLRLVIDAAPSGMIMVNHAGQIVLVNSQIEQLFGYERTELIGKSIEVLVPRHARDKHPDYRSKYFADPKTRAMGIGRDLYGLRKDGTEIPVEIGLNPLMTGGDRFVLASVVDITERKRAEERLRITIEAAPSGMIMVDQDGKIVLVNTQVERLFGYSREELLGQSIEMLVPANVREKHPEHRASFFKNPHARAMGVGRDLFGLRKDGTELPVEIGLNPLEAQGERFVLASIVDITERKKAEALLQEKLLELQRSNEELQQFAYVCSHDLQEPLRVISNYTQLLAKRYMGKTLDDDAHEFIDFTLDATKRMHQLINDLLLYSRVETRGKGFVDVDMNEILQIAESNLVLVIEETNAEISAEPLPTLKGDNSQLVQLFQNLIGNALKFRSEDAPKVSVSVTSHGDMWQFVVSDNGIGFDMKYVDRIFVIFQRLHLRETYEGSGIGLAVCKKIVERHGGRLWAESVPNKGTSFYFTIPKHATKVSL
ncbi:MAG TPA: PAS domain-containing sensor histidine kinase [Candidatus Melainabacteria bacterium]|jgi:PAS domain S-box-containing protein|nr:PAS domain-containing sensor histidine kinase [Candidatus Melainabacteria bacterium]HIN64977.1 PAS domain-containing sensor histidine kinase [Candidatus Obscuribacterales bacterium]